MANEMTNELMNKIPVVLGSPARPFDHNQVDPLQFSKNQLAKAPRNTPVPLPGKFYEQNKAPPSTGTKRNKQTESLNKSATTNPSPPITTTTTTRDSLREEKVDTIAVEEAAKRQRRQRVLVDMHHHQNDAESKDQEDQNLVVVENAYERERLERIKRNQEVMRQMGLRQLAVETAAVVRSVPNPATGGTHAPPRRRGAGPKKSKYSSGPRRSSARNRHQAGEYSEKTDLATLLQEGDADALESLDAEDFLLDLEDYFKINNIDASNAIKVDGHYSGWVSKDVAETYGLPLEHPGDDWIRSAAAAAGGGASTSVGSGKRGRKKGGRGGGSDAKAKSSASLSYNPNAYFYRHVAPHQRQAQGEWTQEEHDKFIDVVREWGVGDNWGLFASHICQRVGYQCSAFYRDVIIPSGAVIDDRFKMTRSGKAVFVR